MITPTYSGDAELCVDLNRSVLEFTPWTHYILADRRDLSYFRQLVGSRTEVIPKEDLLPSGFRRIPGSRRWMCPWTLRPLGGWLVQQVAKLVSAQSLSEDVILPMDSDVILVRHVVEADLVRDHRVRLYRLPGGITPSMRSHVEWHRNACRLLAVEADDPPMADYISTTVSWSRSLILSMLDRLQAVNGRPWYESVARTPQFSECLLYGAYVDKFLGDEAPVWVDGSNHCLNLEGTSPFSTGSIESLVSGWTEGNFAVMIDSHSGTATEVRRAIAAHLSDGRLSFGR